MEQVKKGPIKLKFMVEEFKISCFTLHFVSGLQLFLIFFFIILFLWAHMITSKGRLVADARCSCTACR